MVPPKDEIGIATQLDQWRSEPVMDFGVNGTEGKARGPHCT